MLVNVRIDSLNELSNSTPLNVSKHVKKTNSSIGKLIINNWSSSLEKFIKVVPNDFKNVLKDQQNNKRKKLLRKVSGF